MNHHMLPLPHLTKLLTPSARLLCPQILSEDYAKAAFLCANRSICLHAKYGAHYRTRIPTAGRDLAYVASTAGAPQNAVAMACFHHNSNACTASCWQSSTESQIALCCGRRPHHSGVRAGGLPAEPVGGALPGAAAAIIARRQRGERL